MKLSKESLINNISIRTCYYNRNQKQATTRTNNRFIKRINEKEPNNNMVIKGGDVDYEDKNIGGNVEKVINAVESGQVNIKSIISMDSSNIPVMKDTYLTFNTKNILYGEYTIPNDYVKRIITTVIKSHTIENKGTDNNEWSLFYDNLYKSYPDYSYDQLIGLLKVKTVKVPSVEYVLASAMYAYKSQDAELFTRTINTFGRPLKLKGKNEWLDNWTCNAPCNALNFVFWNDYDNKDIITVSRKFPAAGNNYQEYKTSGGDELITEEDKFKIEGGGNNNIITQQTIKNVRDSNYKIYMLKIVGIFRTFLIVNHLLPTNENYNIESPKDVCDVAVRYFPSYYVACGGCDMFDDNYAPSISTIKAFLSKYNFVSVSAIANASTFRSNTGGSHWVALYFTPNKCCLMCPQANSWSVFKDSGELKASLLNNGFSLENNNVCCQKDNCNCGLYSILFLYCMLVNNGDMVQTAKSIGSNADVISNGKSIFKIKQTLIGYW